MTTYRATWPDVPQLDVTGDELIDVLAQTCREYESLVGDPADDPDYVSPVMSWRLDWNGDRRRLVLVAGGTGTGVRVEEVLHRCDHDCPPVGVGGSVPTGEVFYPEPGHRYSCCGKTGRISAHETWCPTNRTEMAS